MWYHLPDHLRKSKLSPRALPAINLGIDSQRNGYYVYVPELNRITTGYHLSFQERKFLHFTDDGIASLPRGIKPLQDTSLYRKSDNVPTLPRGNVSDGDDGDDDDVNVNDDLQPEMCDHPKCTLPKHNDSIPHSFEDFPSRDKGRNVPRARPASIDNEIYVEPPRGFETKDKEGNECVLKLRKALYGTKQHLGCGNSS